MSCPKIAYWEMYACTQWLETQYVLSSPLSMLIYIFCPDIQQFNSYFFKILQD